MVRIKDSEECRVVSGESGPVAKCSIELLIKNYVRRAKGLGYRGQGQWPEGPTRLFGLFGMTRSGSRDCVLNRKILIHIRNSDIKNSEYVNRGKVR